MFDPLEKQVSNEIYAKIGKANIINGMSGKAWKDNPYPFPTEIKKEEYD